MYHRVNKMAHKKIGTPDKRSAPNASWVQLQRSSLRDLEVLATQNPSACRLLFALVRHMDGQNAVVMSRETMGTIIGASRSTAVRALAHLRQQRWVEIIKVGNLSAVVVNARVAWTQHSKLRHAAIFSATVIATADEQDADTLSMDREPLRRVPVLIPPELATIDEDRHAESGEQQHLPID